MEKRTTFHGNEMNQATIVNLASEPIGFPEREDKQLGRELFPTERRGVLPARGAYSWMWKVRSSPSLG